MSDGSSSMCCFALGSESKIRYGSSVNSLSSEMRCFSAAKSSRRMRALSRPCVSQCAEMLAVLSKSSPFVLILEILEVLDTLALKKPMSVYACALYCYV